MPRKRRQSEKLPFSDSSEPAIATRTRSGADGVDHPFGESPLTAGQWTSLRKRILSDRSKEPLGKIFGKPSRGGSVYRWGIATAIGTACDVETEWLTRLAVGAGTKDKRFEFIDPQAMMLRLQDSLSRSPSGLPEAWAALVWSAAMPGLLNQFDEIQWWNLLGTIQEFRDGLLNRDPTHPTALIGVAEIGLTLSYGLRALPSCRRLVSSSREAIQKWCEQDDLAVSAVLANPHEVRLALASLMRLRRLIPVVTHEQRSPTDQRNGKQRNAKQRKKHSVRTKAFEKAIDEIGIELTTWVAAMTRPGGVQAFSDLGRRAIEDDNGKQGLLIQAAELDKSTLLPAMTAALGTSRTKGRLAWQVGLPEAMMHDEDARVACMLPEWDVRRGRVVMDYGGQQTRLELTAGKSVLISGSCETGLLINGQEIDPVGDWVATCEYTDDDVHYLELEQPHQGGYVLQRQVMVLREDRGFFFADAVVEGHVHLSQRNDPTETSGGNHDKVDASPLPVIEYQLRIPLADPITAEPEPETSELFLSDHRQRAMVLPLSANEWRQAAATRQTARVEATADRHLLLSSRGHGQLYVPMWIDMSRNRFAMKRTWRQLTVAEQMKLLPPRDAVAFRVQVGKRQWILYRSMSAPAPRTFLGKHMIADFYCARFDAKEESYEDLITVEDNAS